MAKKNKKEITIEPTEEKPNEEPVEIYGTLEGDEDGEE